MGWIAVGDAVGSGRRCKSPKQQPKGKSGRDNGHGICYAWSLVSVSERGCREETAIGDWNRDYSSCIWIMFPRQGQIPVIRARSDIP